MPVPAKRAAMLAPAIISDVPGRNRRPSFILTCGRSTKPISEVPRTTTLEGRLSPARSSDISTTVSFDTMRCPCPPVAIDECISIMPA